MLVDAQRCLDTERALASESVQNIDDGRSFKYKILFTFIKLVYAIYSLDRDALEIRVARIVFYIFYLIKHLP